MYLLLALIIESCVSVRFTSCASGASNSESSIFADTMSGFKGGIEENRRVLPAGVARWSISEQ
jgi:hypothetical protein